MPYYRLYLLDPQSGHIEGAEEIHASDDVAAIDEVQQRDYSVPVEMWQGGRKVTRIDAQPDGAAFLRRPVGQPLH